MAEILKSVMIMASVLHPLRRDPEPVVVDVKEMNAPVAETLKTEYEDHLVPDVLIFHKLTDGVYVVLVESG